MKTAFSVLVVIAVAGCSSSSGSRSWWGESYHGSALHQAELAEQQAEQDYARDFGPDWRARDMRRSACAEENRRAEQNAVLFGYETWTQIDCSSIQ